MLTGFWWGNLKERGSLGTPRCRWEDNTEWISKSGLGARTRLIWLRIETGGGHL